MPELTPELKALRDRVVERYDQAKGLHASHQDKWNRYHRQYRGYRELKKTYAQANDVDRESVLRDSMDGYGASLHIPYTFSVVETTLPRMLSNNPRLLITPARPKWEENVENIRLIIDRQQEARKYPLTLQSVGKSGLIYGLGVQKVVQTKEVVYQKRLERGMYNEWVATPFKEKYEGPDAISIDIFDFIWDPMASSMRDCRWAIHRRWLGKEEVKQRFDDGTWKMPAGWDWEDICSLGSSEARNDVWNERMRLAGHNRHDDRGEHVHEVWEFHDGGSEVIVLLDQQLPVASGENPYWHAELPFQIYRPTPVPHEFCGIGEAEAIEDLQIEMDELRTTRRNMGRLALQPPFAYFDGLFDPNDVVFGPGQMFGVDGDPSEILQQIQVRDIPNSGWQEEARLQADIERVTGIDDTVSGGGQQQAQTATGVQLVQAAANIRIQNKTKLCEQELIGPGCYQWLRLDQQFIVEEQEFRGPPKPEEGERQYSWYKVGPAELQGTYIVEPEGGATQATNAAEKMQEAQGLLMMLGNNPLIDQRALLQLVLSKTGVPNPDRLLAPQVPELDMQGIQLLAQGIEQMAGVPMDVTLRLAQEAIQLQQEQEQAQAERPQLPAPSEEAPTMGPNG